MRAWRVHRFGRPSDALELDEVSDPVPGPGEVRSYGSSYFVLSQMQKFFVTVGVTWFPKKPGAGLKRIVLSTVIPD